MPSASLPTLATVAEVASIGSAGISVVGALSQSRASSAAAGYNAKVAAQNSQIQLQNASMAEAQGQQELGAKGAENKARLAALTANQGASGVDINSGSSVGVRESAAKLGMLDALTIRSNAAKQAYGFQTAAASDMGQSQLYKSQAKSDQLGGYLSAGASVLGGIGNAAKYNTYLNKTSPLPWTEPGYVNP